jgi:hypothetical protein
MFSQPESAMAAPQRELESPIHPLKRPRQFTGKKLTGSQFHKIAPITLPEEISLFKWKASGDNLKIGTTAAAVTRLHSPYHGCRRSSSPVHGK